MAEVRRFAPWTADLPDDLTSLEGHRLALDRIAWRNDGRPHPDEMGGWSDDEVEDFVFGIHSHDTLELGGLRLEHIPGEVCALEGLAYLFLMNNRIETIPPQFTETLRLEGLVLDRNPLRDVPAALFEMPGLDNLSLVGTPLTKLQVLQRENPSLKSLVLTDMPWLEIPAGFFSRLPRLKVLVFSRSEQRAIPPEIFDLKHIIQLELEGNPVKVLPSQIGRLNTLLSLNLRKCELTTLPKELGDLVLLEERAGSGPFGLDISGNPFKDKDLKRIAKLKKPEMTKEALAWARSSGH